MYLRPGKNKPEPGPTAHVEIALEPAPGPMQLGFTRGYLSSQAYMDKWGDKPAIGPTHMKGFAKAPISKQWFDFEKPGLPRFGVAFSPHAKATLSLDRVSDAIANAKSSVIYAVMELNGSGKVLEELRALPQREDMFSYGVTQRAKDLSLYTPGQKKGVLVDFGYLKQHVPPHFREEWSGGMGQVIHHKFVVVDFNGAVPIVFAGSSNLAQGGEESNGDNLLAIYDRALVQAYAVEGIRLVDHYEFRNAMQNATKTVPLKLQGATRSRKTPPWWQRFYDPDDISFVERTLFAR